MLFRDDEDDQTVYSVTDTNGSFNVVLQMLEPMTFAEVLRQYAESDSRFSPEVLDILRNTNYPFVELGDRLIVLRWLCERFFETETFKKIIKSDGKIKASVPPKQSKRSRFQNDDICRDCGKAGDVLLCDGCEACYHMKCADLTELPIGKWFCKVCTLHNVQGATDCILPGHRIQSFGFDRHGRLYWFLARRIFM